MIDSGFSAVLVLTSGDLWALFVPLYAAVLAYVLRALLRWRRARRAPRSKEETAKAAAKADERMRSVVRAVLADERGETVSALVVEVRNLLAPIHERLASIEKRTNAIVMEVSDTRASIEKLRSDTEHLQKQYFGHSRRPPSDGGM